MDRLTLIRTRLTDAFNPQRLEITDDSHLHAAHAGARESGGGHFRITIRAEAFTGRAPIERHRMVYEALSDMIPGEIHALSIHAAPPG